MEDASYTCFDFAMVSSLRFLSYKLTSSNLKLIVKHANASKAQVFLLRFLKLFEYFIASNRAHTQLDEVCAQRHILLPILSPYILLIDQR